MREVNKYQGVGNCRMRLANVGDSARYHRVMRLCLKSQSGARSASQ